MRCSGRPWAVQGTPRPIDNDRSLRHLNWSEPWASSVPLVSGAGDQWTGYWPQCRRLPGPMRLHLPSLASRSLTIGGICNHLLIGRVSTAANVFDAKKLVSEGFTTSSD
jgi:hypothetical protein